MRDLLERRRRAASLAGVDLKELRRACGFTQETVAAALGVSRVTVSAWESGRNRPSAAYFRVAAGFMRHLEAVR